MTRNEDNGFSVRKHERYGQPVWALVSADGQPVEQAERFIHTLVLRGLSPRTWRAYAYDLLEAYRWMDEANRQPEQIAGDDQLVSAPAALAYFDALTVADKTLFHYENLYHEIYNEKQPDRDKVLADLKQWVAARFL